MMAVKRGRGRPKGAKNIPKTKRQRAPAASGTVTTDHNQKDNVVPFKREMTPEQEKTLFFQHRRKYEDALAKKKAVDADLRNICKLAKGDGVSIEAVKLSLKDVDVLEAKVRSEIEMFHKVTNWLALPIGGQLRMDFDEPDRRHSDDKAFADGEVAGLSGQSQDPPYDSHLPQANMWRQGWSKGQEALRSKFKLSDEKTEAKPKKTAKKNGAQQEDQPSDEPFDDPVGDGFIGAGAS